MKIDKIMEIGRIIGATVTPSSEYRVIGSTLTASSGDPHTVVMSRRQGELVSTFKKITCGRGQTWTEYHYQGVPGKTVRARSYSEINVLENHRVTCLFFRNFPGHDQKLAWSCSFTPYWNENAECEIRWTVSLYKAAIVGKPDSPMGTRFSRHGIFRSVEMISMLYGIPCWRTIVGDDTECGVARMFLDRFQDEYPEVFSQ